MPVRSGLISKTQLFSPEELTELYRATDYLLDEARAGRWTPQSHADRKTKIEYTVPDLADRLEQDEAQEPQIDMMTIRKAGKPHLHTLCSISSSPLFCF